VVNSHHKSFFVEIMGATLLLLFEYLENYEKMFSKISRWIVPQTGILFIHSFCHRDIPIRMSAPNSENWITTFFGRGGTLPSQDYYLYFQKDFYCVDHWIMSGSHYARTVDFWLKRMDCYKQQTINALTEAYSQDAHLWFRRWRFLCILLSELFSTKQFLISHYVFKRK
jgi:cyclopropane-fatty-acyl-phospholipid synthase